MEYKSVGAGFWGQATLTCKCPAPTSQFEITCFSYISFNTGTLARLQKSDILRTISRTAYTTITLMDILDRCTHINSCCLKTDHSPQPANAWFFSLVVIFGFIGYPACSVCDHFITNLILLLFKTSATVPCRIKPQSNTTWDWWTAWNKKHLQNGQSLFLHRKQDISSALA